MKIQNRTDLNSSAIFLTNLNEHIHELTLLIAWLLRCASEVNYPHLDLSLFN